MRQRTVGVCIRAGLVLGVLCVPVSAQSLTEAEIQQRYLGIVEESVKAYEPLWADDSANVPNSGFFDFRKYNNWEPPWYAPEITVPGNGMVVFSYAVLLTQTDKETFSDQNIPRATLLDHAIKAIRWCCLTSAYVDHPYPYPIAGGYERRILKGSWVRPIGHRTDVLGWLTVGAGLLWDKLDADTRKMVEQVCIGAAPKERILRAWEYGQGGNQDVVKQDLGSTIGAAFLFPQRPDRNLYLDLVGAAGIDMVSTPHDRACTAPAEGRPVRDWASGWNLYQDYSSDHHGWAQVWYGIDKLFEGRYYVEILSHLTGIAVPETYTYPGSGFDGILDWAVTTCLPEGEPASVHGMEYDAYYGAGVLAYSYASTVTKDPIAAALEDRALNRLERHSRAVAQYDYHRNSSAKAAAALLMHKYRGPRVEPIGFTDAWQILNGAHHYRWQQTLVHRANDRWASFSWGSISRHERPRPTGFIVPARGLKADIEPLIYLHPESMAGEVSFRYEGGPAAAPDSLYRYACSDTGFRTAGVVSDQALQRYYAAWSFDSGPYVCMTAFKTVRSGRLTWSGLPVYFYVRPGLTGSRRYHDAEGNTALEQTLNHKSNWWCVNDAIGLVAAGGNGQVHVERSVGNNWARTSEYRDKCDGVFVSPIADQAAGPGDVPVSLTVAVYPDRPFDQISEASKVFAQYPLALPEGWKGLIVPDAPPTGRRFLAVANLFGKETQAPLTLALPEGAGILSCQTIVTGRVGSCTLELAGLETFGQALELYAEALNGKTVYARQETPRLYEFHPPAGQTARVRLRYRGVGGQAILIRPATGEGSRRITLNRLDADRSFTVDVAGLTYVGIEGPGYEDQTGPAIEITNLSVREDGRVTIEVAANDHSGLQSVDLYCDGQPIGQRVTTPYTWTHFPAEGYHTYQVMAIDASPQANTRASFKRTILVSKPEGGASSAPAAGR